MRILFVDFSNVATRAFYAVHTRNSEGLHSGMFFGALKSLGSKIAAYSIDEVYVMYDTKPYWRTTVFPSYKGDRGDFLKKLGGLANDFVEQKEDLRVLLPRLGFKCVSKKTFEADDLISAYVWSFSRDSNNQCFIFSSDHDFLQLVSPNVSVIKGGADNGFVDVDNFSEMTGIPDPSIVKHVYAVAGDKSDFIPSMFSEPRIDDEDRRKLRFVEPLRAISVGKVVKILSSPFNSVDNLLEGKMNYVKGIGRSTEELFLNIKKEQVEAYKRNLTLVDLSDGEHKFELLDKEPKQVVETSDEPASDLLNFYVRKYECHSIKPSGQFPFFRTGEVNKAEIDQKTARGFSELLSAGRKSL